jgi:hypothetical protein
MTNSVEVEVEVKYVGTAKLVLAFLNLKGIVFCTFY